MTIKKLNMWVSLTEVSYEISEWPCEEKPSYYEVDLGSPEKRRIKKADIGVVSGDDKLSCNSGYFGVWFVGDLDKNEEQLSQLKSRMNLFAQQNFTSYKRGLEREIKEMELALFALSSDHTKYYSKEGNYDIRI